MSEDEEIKKALEGFNKSFFQKLLAILWQLLLGTLAYSALHAWITDTFVESDGPFAMYFAAVIVVIAIADLILRIQIKRESKHENAG
ncbi:hypothetical protein phiAS5_ORF0207 [Aeromonas phage phiAS5]|uniref:Uncharacterized protein n=1 Tax=Aeromonas phage phiAS5 TaxID=879630 RepID=E1A2V4_9CAUD|nr:hypothetical protein phiAS5_ORF0207 [Aeromonas phage phiAS5]ADM80050.1 hypothetical protein phiAS5_ORF0207 [Aeromonas phage phiAS5]